MFTFLFLVAIIVLGLLVGSFLNVVTLRLMKGEQIIWGRSRCPNCQVVLRYRDLIPLFSFLVLHGRCRGCQQPISWQYSLVELATGILFGLVAFFHVASQPVNLIVVLILLRDLVFTAGLIMLFVFDYRWYVLPDQVTVPLLFFAFTVNWLLGVPFRSLLLGVVVGGGFYLVLWLISGGKWVGSGDIRLGALLGAMLGWPATLIALYIAYIIGGFTAAILLLKGKKKMGGKLPMGVFLTIGAFAALLFSEPLTHLWFTVFVF